VVVNVALAVISFRFPVAFPANFTSFGRLIPKLSSSMNFIISDRFETAEKVGISNANASGLVTF